MIKKTLELALCSLILSGCDVQEFHKPVEKDPPIEINVKEKKNINFFDINNDFAITEETKSQIINIVQEAATKGIENAAFIIISNVTIPTKQQQELKDLIYQILYKANFVNTRIMDLGLCVYDGAKCGVRIDLLKYDLKAPDISEWDESIGDTNLNKNLPKFGVSAIYNFGEMLANKADIVNPRVYKGQEVKAAISAMGGSSGSSGGESSGGGV